jgi:hypothetical protein
MSKDRAQAHRLAEELRQRQYAKGLVDRRIIDEISDDDLIDSYITCPDCGGKQVNEKQLEAAIREARDAEDFFALCDAFSRSSPHKH